MTKKQEIIKYIADLALDKISNFLKNNKVQTNITKNTLIKKFSDFKLILNNKGLTKFCKTIEGRCIGVCHFEAKGVTFVSNNKDYLNLIIEELDDGTINIFTCISFHNDDLILGNNNFHLSHYDDYISKNVVSDQHKEQLCNLIVEIVKEFDTFKSKVTTLEEFCKWNISATKIYEDAKKLNDISLESICKPLYDLLCTNSEIQTLYDGSSLARKGMQEFVTVDLDDEVKLLDWVLRYSYADFIQNFFEHKENKDNKLLIYHSKDSSIVLDCTEFSESLTFSKIHEKFYWEFFEKYRIEDEEFEAMKEQNEGQRYDLLTFVNFYNNKN